MIIDRSGGRPYKITPGVNARDRIGSGPWHNAKGVMVAKDVDDLHSDNNKLGKQGSLTEKGDVVNGRGDSPNMHDILTGSTLDGRAFPAMEGRFVFKHATRRMPEVLLETLDSAGVKITDVDLFLFHQANLRINEYVAKQLGLPALNARTQESEFAQLVRGLVNLVQIAGCGQGPPVRGAAFALSGGPDSTTPKVR